MRNPDDWDMKLIAEWKETGKLPAPSKLVELLVGIVLAHDEDGAGPSEIPIERELLEIIGRRLEGNVAWAKAHNAQRARRARKDRDVLKAEASAIWAAHPSYSAARVAAIIAENGGRKAGTIRKAIRKK